MGLMWTEDEWQPSNRIWYAKRRSDIWKWIGAVILVALCWAIPIYEACRGLDR